MKETVFNAKRQHFYDRTWLYVLRIKAQMTLQEAADLNGISLAFYNRIEKGAQLPDVKLGLRMASNMGFDPQEWINETQLL